MKDFLLDIWLVLTHPSCWIQIYPYSRRWDKEFRELLKTHSFHNVEPYYAQIGRHRLWIANIPYGSFQHPEFKIRAARATILRGAKKLGDRGDSYESRLRRYERGGTI